MDILTRYILRQLAVALVLGTCSLMVLLWLIHSLRFFDGFINKGLSIGTFLKLTVLLMPAFLTFFLPIALFAVVLFVYNRMTADRELMVLQAAGVGLWRLSRPAFLLAGGLCVFSYYLTLDAVPRLERAFNTLRFEIHNEIGRLALTEGAFNEVSEGLTLYVRDSGDGTAMEGLVIHDRREPDAVVTITARRGALVMSDGQPQVLMVDGVRQERDRDSGRVSFLFFDSHTLAIGDREAAGMVRVPESRERSTYELFTLTTDDIMAPDFPHPFTEGNVRRMRMEGHQRLSKPLANLTFTLLALGALLGGEFRRQGRNRRIGVAVVTVVLAQSMVLGGTNLARQDLIYLPLLYLGPLCAGGLGLWWMSGPVRRARRLARAAAGRPAPQAGPA